MPQESPSTAYKLYNDTTSPFGRKVLVTALEAGLPIQEKFVSCFDYGSLVGITPLHQIPVLEESGNGRRIFDSTVALQELAAHSPTGPHYPSDDSAKLTLIAAMDGLMETVLKRVLELKRPPEQQSQTFADSMTLRIHDCLHWLQDNLHLIKGPGFDIPQICAACALEYVNFRFSTDWQESYEEIAAWLDLIADRPSMVRTRPTRTAPISIIMTTQSQEKP